MFYISASLVHICTEINFLINMQLPIYLPFIVTHRIHFLFITVFQDAAD